ncbi:MAG: FAD-dependent oxidoreductase, partial [Dehalococcoidia bacterium]|nr:FAD-dependent oxidoreductase [Dehalococcoidia bacterium]
MMTTATTRGTVVEPQKEVPLSYDVDVAVVGAGIAGLCAALTAGRQGAKTLLIDRFGSLGGN